jgi:hypothetical protein
MIKVKERKRGREEKYRIEKKNKWILQKDERKNNTMTVKNK